MKQQKLGAIPNIKITVEKYHPNKIRNNLKKRESIISEESGKRIYFPRNLLQFSIWFNKTKPQILFKFYGFKKCWKDNRPIFCEIFLLNLKEKIHLVLDTDKAHCQNKFHLNLTKDSKDIINKNKLSRIGELNHQEICLKKCSTSYEVDYIATMEQMFNLLVKCGFLNDFSSFGSSTTNNPEIVELYKNIRLNLLIIK